MSKMWTQQAAIDLARWLETMARQCGGHVALTGGCLYHDGERKDVDIIVYNHGTNNNSLEYDRLMRLLHEAGFAFAKKQPGKAWPEYQRVVKVKYLDRTIDLMFPNALGDPAESNEEFPEGGGEVKL